MLALQHVEADAKDQNPTRYAKRAHSDPKQIENDLTQQAEGEHGEEGYEGRSGSYSASLLGAHPLGQAQEDWRIGDWVHHCEEPREGCAEQLGCEGVEHGLNATSLIERATTTDAWTRADSSLVEVTCLRFAEPGRMSAPRQTR